VPVDNRTGVFVLQHPRERAHPLGTARFVELGLRKSEVVVAENEARDLYRPMTLPPRTGLLYPREGAANLEDLPIAERPEHLLVLDGTWSHARTLYRMNPWLASLPHYRLSPHAPSRYRIRKEPRPDYVSTLESVLLALAVLEPETRGGPELLAAFDAMIDEQIRRSSEALRTGLGRRKKRAPVRPFRGVPRWLGEDYARVVLVYAEALARSEHSAQSPRTLIQLAAVRLSTGKRFERLVRPESGVPDDDALAVLGLSREDFANAIEPGDLRADFAGFCEPRDLLVAWNRPVASLVRGATQTPHRVHLLKPVARGEHVARSRRDAFPTGKVRGTLDALGAMASADPVVPLAFRGRAGTRLANLWRVAEWTRVSATRAGAVRPRCDSEAPNRSGP
jgi:hypothetical protein